MSDDVEPGASWRERIAVTAALITGIVLARTRALDKLGAAVARGLGFGSAVDQRADQPASSAGKEGEMNAGSQAVEEIRTPITPGGPGIVRGR